MLEKRFNHLETPLISQYEDYLPTAFSGELTLLQKINKIIKDLERSFQLTNEMVDYLNQFIKTFDEKLYKTIEDVLQVWLEDGLLADVIREAINDEVIEARTDYLGKKYMNLKERLDKERKEVIDSRGGATTLGERLDSEKADVGVKLSQIAIYLDNRLEGETDDTLRLQRALDYLKVQYDLGNHYKLILPPNTLKISSPLTLKLVKGATIEGSGKGVTIIENTGTSNAFEVGVMGTDLWDEALKTLVTLKNLTIKGNQNSGHGLVIHSVGSVIENCSFEYNGKIGLYSNGLSYLRVSASDCKENKIGFYAHWSVYFDKMHVTANSVLGGYLGESCKIINSLIEWQKPKSGYGPRLPGLIIKGSLHQALVQNCYLEHDYFYIGYNQSLNPETCTFGTGRIENENAILDNCVLSDQSILYIDSGNLSVKSVSFPGSNFGIQPMRTYAQYTTVGLTPPKITYDLGTEKLNIGRSSSFFYVPTTQRNLITNPSFYGIESKSTGTNTVLDLAYGWMYRDHLWNAPNFNVDMRQVTDVPTWSPMKTALKYEIFSTIGGNEIPKYTYDSQVEEGKVYFVSFDYKTTGDCLYVAEGLTSGENYLHTDYVIGGTTRKYDSFNSPVWARRIKAFRAKKTETVRLMFQAEVRKVGRGFTITNVCISEDGGVAIPEKGLFKGSIPSSGTWKIGDVVYNDVPTAETPTEKWLRVTNGTTNVLGTDWIAK